MWLLIFGLANFILLAFTAYFLLDKKQIKKIKFTPDFLIQRILENIKPLSIILIVVGIHLIEVKLIDPYVTNWVGYDYANIIQNLENGFVHSFTNYWTPGILHFFVLIYIVIYPFTLWFSPLYFIVANKKQALNSLAYGLLIIYLVALPFYLFLPIKNVYNFYNSPSALEIVIPSIEAFFYSTTTANNCLPSLHTAMTILVAYCLSLSGNKKLKYFGIFIATTVIISVVYLSIHWILDVIAGAILSFGAIFLLRRYIKDK
jgi:membrane-associated phospholipid phosphatase